MSAREDYNRGNWRRRSEDPSVLAAEFGKITTLWINTYTPFVSSPIQEGFHDQDEASGV